MTSAEVPARVKMNRPFANSGTKSDISFLSGSTINYPDGFPTSYSAVDSLGGKAVSRADMNAIGNLATNDSFIARCGILNQFDQDFCDAIGGYPKGAVLKYVTGTYIYDVMSLIENNTVDFTTSGVDGVTWAYCNKDIAISEKTLVFQWANTINFAAISQDFAQTLLGVMKAPLNGVITSEATFSASTLSSTMTSGLYSGVGLFVYDLGESYTSVPTLTIDTISDWVMLNLSGGTLRGTNESSPTIGNISASYNHYYAISTLAGKSWIKGQGTGIAYSYLASLSASINIYIG